MGSRAPRLASKHALSLTTIASKLAPTISFPLSGALSLSTDSRNFLDQRGALVPDIADGLVHLVPLKYITDLALG
ncbi:hypothetical protein D3C80_1037720 [compost metagenome]